MALGSILALLFCKCVCQPPVWMLENILCNLLYLIENAMVCQGQYFIHILYCKCSTCVFQSLMSWYHDMVCLLYHGIWNILDILIKHKLFKNKSLATKLQEIDCREYCKLWSGTVCMSQSIDCRCLRVPR